MAIAEDGRTPGERYFDREYRCIISSLVDQGDWERIESLGRDQLREELLRSTARDGISDQRVDTLAALLDNVKALDRTDGVTLEGLGGIPYSSFVDTLAELPGVSRSDAWWLLLVTFDKPVWPADKHVDGLLVNLGLLDPGDWASESYRRESIEEKLPRRMLPQFHRALAAHGVKGSIDTCGESCEIRKFLLSHRLRRQRKVDSGPVIVDLFSGAGGLSLGFCKAGGTVDLAVDSDVDATDTYRLNHPELPHRRVVCGDIRNLNEQIVGYVDRQPDVVVGGPPCQSLSLAGYRSRLSADKYSILEDERTGLYEEFVGAIERLRPRMILMENVDGMANRVDGSDVRVIDLVLQDLRSAGYVSEYRLIDCSQYGVPQKRERVFVVGVRRDLASELNPEDVFDGVERRDSTPTILQALSGVPKIRRGEGGRVTPLRQRGSRSKFVREQSLENGTDITFNHRAREHPKDKDRKLFDEALEPGETSYDVKYKEDSKYEHLLDYDIGTKDNPRFKDKYRMLQWDSPAPTIVAHLAKDANGFILPDYQKFARPDGVPVPERNRGITPREAARLQTFPDSYIFLGSFTSWFRQIGNAVPPLLGKKLANSIYKSLEERGISRIQQVGTIKSND